MDVLIVLFNSSMEIPECHIFFNMGKRGDQNPKAPRRYTCLSTFAMPQVFDPRPALAMEIKTIRTLI